MNTQDPKELHDLVCSQQQIAQQLCVQPKTIRRYLHSSSSKTRRSRAGRLIDPFQAYLINRWNEGCHNATPLFREIQQQGYAGRTTMVRSVIREFRDARRQTTRIRTAKQNHCQSISPGGHRHYVHSLSPSREDQSSVRRNTSVCLNGSV